MPDGTPFMMPPSRYRLATVSDLACAPGSLHDGDDLTGLKSAASTATKAGRAGSLSREN
jgi:hypothetical protein